MNIPMNLFFYKNTKYNLYSSIIPRSKINFMIKKVFYNNRFKNLICFFTITNNN